MDAAGMGFFGIVFYAVLKTDFAIEASLLRSDPFSYNSRRSLQAVRAVKICNPLCPSGVKASASYIMKDMRAMKMVRGQMEEHIQHNFVRLLDYSTSESPWYSMEPVLCGLTLEKVYLASQRQGLPVPEELAFHVVDQMSQACLLKYGDTEYPLFQNYTLSGNRVRRLSQQPEEHQDLPITACPHFPAHS
jgi:hypothetical protein